MGWKRAIRNPIAREAYDRFMAMPNMQWGALDTPYCAVAFALSTNSNPNTPLTGYAVYACEVVRMTSKSVTLWLGEPIERYGWGRLPKNPLRVIYEKSQWVKLLGKVKEENGRP